MLIIRGGEVDDDRGRCVALVHSWLLRVGCVVFSRAAYNCGSMQRQELFSCEKRHEQTFSLFSQPPLFDSTLTTPTKLV